MRTSSKGETVRKSMCAYMYVKVIVTIWVSPVDYKFQHFNKIHYKFYRNTLSFISLAAVRLSVFCKVQFR